MKRILISCLAYLLSLTTVLAQSTGVPYFPQTLPASTVVGRLGAGAGATQAIPFATFASLVNTAWLASNNTFTGTANFTGTSTFTSTTTFANIVLGASNSIAFSTDTFIIRPSAATIQLGAADAAAPVSQNFTIQSVVAGTTNTQGANLAINGSKSTGTGLGGEIGFYVSLFGTTGSAQNALVQTFALDARGHLRPGGTTPVLSSCGTSPAIVGSDTAGTVTMGTGAPTGCVITFTKPFLATLPLCVVTWAATPLASQSYVAASATLTLTQTGTSSNKVNYVCFAPP